MEKNKTIIRVRHIMRTDFGSIDGIATVDEALRKMKELKTSVLVVEKRHDDDEYGLITSSDIARHVLARDRSPQRVNVYEIMEKPVIAVHPDMDIRYCSRLFARYNLVRAPVIDSRRVIGMVSPNALVLDGLYQLLE
ncbi:MAG: CBS domain-containing protein [Methylohalobius sp. ZOD2]|uniref:CBS domain-containing protein n=1 Tax=Methylohalobius crimeensis TaxID=244365 RepID=UPI0003B3309F|nr:CBS domain-containing protein [Methylohalobius crimeensis]